MLPSTVRALLVGSCSAFTGTIIPNPNGSAETAIITIDDATTRNALIAFMNTQRLHEPYGGWWESTNLLTMAMMTPEFHVA